MLQADQEAAQVADTCGSNGASVCGSQAHDIRDTVPSTRHEGARSDRNTAPESICRPDSMSEQPISLKPYSGGRETSSGASFCEEIRNRTRKMQQEMKKREDSIANLHIQIQHLQDKHR